MNATETPAEGWTLYLLRCAGDRLYAGITNRFDARMEAHARGRGAKFTAAFAPEQLVARRACPSRRDAAQAEWALKQLPKADKISFFRPDELERQRPKRARETQTIGQPLAGDASSPSTKTR